MLQIDLQHENGKEYSNHGWSLQIWKTANQRTQKKNNDRDFILGVLSDAKTEENFKICLDFIKQGIDVTEPNLLMLSLDLDKEGACNE